MKKGMIQWLALCMALALCACAAPQKSVETTEQTVAVTEAAAEPETAAETEAVPVETKPAMGVTFSTVDAQGNAVDETIFAGHKLIMLNFWEPWCGPCVMEMPDLQRIHEEYADQGLLLLGIHYSSEGMEEVLREAGITYPILEYREEFYPFTTEYVPTTVFLDAEGYLLDGPYTGSRAFEAWAGLIEKNLD